MTERGIIQFTMTFKPSFVESRGGIGIFREALYEKAHLIPEIKETSKPVLKKRPARKRF